MDAFEQIVAANYTQREADMTEQQAFERVGIELTAEVYAYLRQAA